MTVLEALRKYFKAEEEMKDTLAELESAGYKIVNSELVRLEAEVSYIPASPDEWKHGDIVECISLNGAGVASLTVGNQYLVDKGRTSRSTGIIDDDGDSMCGCVQSGCFKWISRGK